MIKNIYKDLCVILAGIAIFLCLSGCQNPFLHYGYDGVPNASGDFSSRMGPTGEEEVESPLAPVNSTVKVSFYWPNNYSTYLGAPVYTQDLDLIDGIIVEDVDWDAVYYAYTHYAIQYEGYPLGSEFTAIDAFAWFYGTDDLSGPDTEIFESLVTGWYFNDGIGVEHYSVSEHGFGPDIDIMEKCVEIDGRLELSLAPKFKTKAANFYLCDLLGLVTHSLYLNEVINIAPGNIDEFLDLYYLLFSPAKILGVVEANWTTMDAYYYDAFLAGTRYAGEKYDLSIYPWDRVLLYSARLGAFDDGTTLHYFVY